MNRFSILMITGALLSGAPLSAQTEHSGKLLTMEDVIVNPKVHPARYGTRKRPSAQPGLPKEARNVCKSTSGLLSYTVDGSLFLHNPANSKTDTIALSTDPGIRYGETVSRNEFGIEGGEFWSPKGGKLAFYRKDERDVTLFPLLDIKSRTGSLMNIRYPMNGMASEKISLGVYSLDNRSTIWITPSEFGEDRYLTNISWSEDEKYIFIQVVDRSQHHCVLNMYSAENGSYIRTILTEDNDAWIEPLDPLYPVKGSYRFIYRTDNRDGYRNLYLCDTLGLIRRLTPCDADVEYVANDGRYLYYTSAEVSPVENHFFRVDLKQPRKKPVQLTQTAGWHNISMNEECTAYVDNWSSLEVPRVVDSCSCDGRVLKNLLTAADPLDEFAKCEVSLGTVKSADGKFDNWYRLIKPLGFDPSKKYPVVVYVYGGPHSQMVRNSWLGQIRMWEMLMAQKGYVVYVQDNRGTQNRGSEFEKAINRQCGQAEMADQMMGVQMLLNQPWVDSSRIGVHGWSYGGFMTISLLTNYPEVFKVGVAGGPVIDWKWYEIMYGERYMDTAETNPEGFEKVSLMNKTSDVKGKLLICQGAIDNTVVWEHSLSFVQKCIEENVQLDYFPYPCSEHNVFGRWRIHLMDKVTAYFDANL